MTNTARQGGWLIVMTIIMAMALTIVPLPQSIVHFRPEWVALVIIYWCMALPQRVGVGRAWMAGLLVDVMTGSLLGQHALGMTVVAFLVINLYQRIRLFPLGQQAFVIWMLLNLYQLLLLWFDGITGQPPKGLNFWWPPLIGMLFWPAIFLMLRRLRRKYKVQ